jgi:hypothetical protein
MEYCGQETDFDGHNGDDSCADGSILHQTKYDKQGEPCELIGQHPSFHKEDHAYKPLWTCDMVLCTGCYGKWVEKMGSSGK